MVTLLTDVFFSEIHKQIIDELSVFDNFCWSSGEGGLPAVFLPWNQRTDGVGGGESHNNHDDCNHDDSDDNDDNGGDDDNNEDNDNLGDSLEQPLVEHSRLLSR